MKVPPEYRDKPLIGSQVPWKKIEGELLRVTRFIRLCDLGTRSCRAAWSWALMDLSDNTQHGAYTPIAHYLDLRRSLYALIEVECPQKLPAPAYMPVRHRFDFCKLGILFDPFGDGKSYFVAPDEEVLLGFPIPLEGLAKQVVPRPLMPRLWFFIKPKGYLEWQYGPHGQGEPPPGGWDWRPNWEREAKEATPTGDMGIGVKADEAEPTRIDPFLYWVRWVGALPAALLAVLAVSLPVHLAALMISSRSGGEDQALVLSNLPPDTLERFGQAFFAPLVFIFIGAKVAPAFKLHTALALMILWAMALGAALTYGATTSAYEGWGWAEFAGVGILGVAGLVSGGFAVYENLRHG